MDEWKNFVTAQELQSHWKVLPAELLDFIHSGLPVYRQTGILIEASELLPEKTLLDIKKELALRAARDIEARKCRSFITLANIPSSFDPRDFRNTIIPKVPSTPPTANTETSRDIHTEAKSLFEKLKKRKDNQTLADLHTFLFKRKEINVFAQLRKFKTIDDVEASQEDGTTTQDSKTIPKPRVAIVYDEADKLRRNNPSMDKVMAKKRIDHILQRHNYPPYGRTQFNRIIKDLHFKPAPRGRKSAKPKK